MMCRLINFKTVIPDLEEAVIKYWGIWGGGYRKSNNQYPEKNVKIYNKK